MNITKLNRLTEKLSEARAKVKAIEDLIAGEVSGKAPVVVAKKAKAKGGNGKAKPASVAGLPTTSVVDQVKAYFSMNAGREMTVERIGADLGLEPKSYRTLLPKLRQSGFLDSPKRGVYALHKE